MQYRI